ncbi:hypothetical protein PGT21_017942 [Puccinia graminis f. sp. tritici]|uniref:RING-type domain-containing protein n=1 Tax=Puccinia graminis f. sp. tritici TaxID=56615 RepID=A0A5B0NAG8_PUCGR|nr:hypothetical protein PGT21_017942 [Puccinia graminis f. sp. tritici]
MSCGLLYIVLAMFIGNGVGMKQLEGFGTMSQEVKTDPKFSGDPHSLHPMELNPSIGSSNSKQNHPVNFVEETSQIHNRINQFKTSNTETYSPILNKNTKNHPKSQGENPAPIQQKNIKPPPETCWICHDAIEKWEDPIQIPKCLHIYHEDYWRLLDKDILMK